MQNLVNITSAEVAVVGNAILVLCAAPTVLAWNDARRRRKALAQAAARERALAEAAARERVLAEAAAREAALSGPPRAVYPAVYMETATPNPIDLQQLWDEPTVTVDAELLSPAAAAPPAAAVLEVPSEPTAPRAAPPIAEVTAPPPTTAVPEVHAELVPEAEPLPGAAPHFEFCLEELRRVRLPNWPPAEVQTDPVRGEVWREAERLAVQHQREIGAAPLVSPHRAQSSCLGSAEADAATMRLHFLLFPVLWPSTEEQATAEAVFEIDRAGGTIRSYVNSLRRKS